MTPSRQARLQSSGIGPVEPLTRVAEATNDEGRADDGGAKGRAHDDLLYLALIK